MKKNEVLTINLDAYEYLEYFINTQETYRELLKANLALKHHMFKVEFLRFFIV